MSTGVGIAQIITGDCIVGMQSLPDSHVQTVITSPPYFSLRDYGVEGQIGVESSPEEYVENLVNVFREVKRILRDDGTLWLNLGDSYSGSNKGIRADGTYQDRKNPKLLGMRLPKMASIEGLPAKNLLGIPWRVAFALQADGWFLRQELIWHKPNAQPEAMLDRVTDDHEHIFLLSKKPRYYFDVEAIREPIIERGFHRGGHRRKRSVWSVNTKPNLSTHIAAFPTALLEPMVLAGTSAHGSCSVCASPWFSDKEGHWTPSCKHDASVVPCKVFDPFTGSGTTAVVAMNLGRDFVGTELNPEYVKIAEERLLRDVIRPMDFDA